jgi:hypothetical protein
MLPPVSHDRLRRAQGHRFFTNNNFVPRWKSGKFEFYLIKMEKKIEKLVLYMKSEWLIMTQKLGYLAVHQKFLELVSFNLKWRMVEMNACMCYGQGDQVLFS